MRTTIITSLLAAAALLPGIAAAQDREDRGNWQQRRAEMRANRAERPDAPPQAQPQPQPRQDFQPRGDRPRPGGDNGQWRRPSAGRPDGAPDAGPRLSRPDWQGGRPGWQGGRPDGGRPDAGRPGAGRPDGGRPDGGRPDAGRPDWQGGRPDAGRPGWQGGRPDAGRPGWQGGRPDSGRPGWQGGRPDAGRPGWQDDRGPDGPRAGWQGGRPGRPAFDADQRRRDAARRQQLQRNYGDWNDGYRGDRGFRDRSDWGGRGWNRGWRSDRRYDWSGYRGADRNRFHLPRYYAPYGWDRGYRRFSVGVRLSSVLFAQSYWIDDPFGYRLPPAYGPYRWVRYYNDALLVDVRYGNVVDVVYDIFW